MWPLGTAGYAGCFTLLHYSFSGRVEKAAVGLIAWASATICDACIAECVAVLQAHDGLDFSIRPHDTRNQSHHA
jgi:alkylhydroperoxidase family enzyme